MIIMQTGVNVGRRERWFIEDLNEKKKYLLLSPARDEGGAFVQL